MSRNSLDLNRLIGKIAGVLMEPYTNFIAKLYADGRITDAEVEELKRSFEQRVPQLAELVEERLKEEKEDSES